jgi:hypothetical protein
MSESTRILVATVGVSLLLSGILIVNLVVA